MPLVNSVMLPDGVTRPIAGEHGGLSDAFCTQSVNHRLPSGPATRFPIWLPAGRPALNIVIAPDGVTMPRAPVAPLGNVSAKYRLPSNQIIPPGEPPGRRPFANTVITPDGVIWPMPPVPPATADMVNHRSPPGPGKRSLPSLPAGRPMQNRVIVPALRSVLGTGGVAHDALGATGVGGTLAETSVTTTGADVATTLPFVTRAALSV